MLDSASRTSLSPVLADLLFADPADWVGRSVETLTLTFEGLQGDRHGGSTRRTNDGRTPWHPRGTRIANTRQISMVSVEECIELAAVLGLDEVDPALLGPNLVLQGIASFSLLPAATRLQFPSGATLFVTEQNTPCHHPAKRIATTYQDPRLSGAFNKAAAGRRGLLALVEREGTIQAGDPVRIVAARTAVPVPVPAGVPA